MWNRDELIFILQDALPNNVIKRMRELKYAYCVNRFNLLIISRFYYLAHCIWQMQLASYAERAIKMSSFWQSSGKHCQYLDAIKWWYKSVKNELCVCAEKVWKCAVCGGLNWLFSCYCGVLPADTELSQLPRAHLHRSWGHTHHFHRTQTLSRFCLVSCFKEIT